MRIACVAVDDQSIVTFTRTMSVLLESRGHSLITIGSVGTHRDELSTVASTHIDCGPTRYPSPLEDLRYVVGLRAALRTARPDLLILFTTKPNTLGSISARLAGVPRVVVAVRGLGQAFDIPEDHPGGVAPSDRIRTAMRASVRGGIRRATFRLYRHAFARCELAWFTNEADRAYFVDRGACDVGKTMLTTNAIDLEEFDRSRVPAGTLSALRSELGIPDSGRVVIMIARLLRAKGVIEFIDAACAVRRTRPDARFLLLAPTEPDSDDRIEEAVVRAASPDVTWLGLRKDVRDLCALADLAVLPSYYREGGFPRALLEPMALGVPVIAADTPECRGPVDPGVNGLLVPPRDPSALAGAIGELLDDPARRAEMGAASRRRVEERFDDAKVLAGVLDRIGVVAQR